MKIGRRASDRDTQTESGPVESLDPRTAFKPNDHVTWSPPTSKVINDVAYPAIVKYLSEHKICIEFETPDGRIVTKFVYARSLKHRSPKDNASVPRRQPSLRP